MKHRPYLASVRFAVRGRYKLEAFYSAGDEWPNITTARKQARQLRNDGFRTEIIKRSVVEEVVS